VKAFRQINKFAGDSGGAFASWLTRICINCSLDFLRKQKRRHAQDTVSLEDVVLDPVDVGESPQRCAERAEATRLVADAAKQLSPKQRVVWDLRYSQHHSIREIAGMLSCSENAVKTHLSRSNHKLKSLLQPLWSER
jgi:RNA polymerase sigma-70 factor (ECF subfamily)